MKHPRLLLLPLALVLFGAGCASGRAGSALYRAELGNLTRTDAIALTEQVLNRYAYQIEQSETEPEIRYLTQWKPRRPFADELALGITGAENRIIVVGRLRGQTELGSYYNVNMTIENRVQVAGDTNWNETTNTAMFREYAETIAKDYQQLVQNIGVRRF